MSNTLRSSRSLLRAACLCVALTSSASAHDFWIQPSTFRPDAGTRVAIELRVGEQFKGEPVARNPERIERFVVRPAASAELSISGIDGRSPAGYWRAAGEGVAWIAYHSRPSRLELAPAKFESYLEHEGLERVIEMRKVRGETDRPGREQYSRCAKSLVRVGGAGASDASAVSTKIGLPLELFPERDPYALKIGDELSVRLTYLDRPLEGALVGCMVESDPAGEVRLRSDAEGRVRFKLATSGVWLVRAVHMARAPADSDADWESLWASLTFDVR